MCDNLTFKFALENQLQVNERVSYTADCPTLQMGVLLKW